MNVALVEAAGTVTLAGMVAAATLLLESGTIAPPAGAGPDNVAVPCAVLPPIRLVGINEIALKVTARELTVSEALLDTPP